MDTRVLLSRRPNPRALRGSAGRIVKERGAGPRGAWMTSLAPMCSTLAYRSATSRVNLRMLHKKNNPAGAGSVIVGVVQLGLGLAILSRRWSHIRAACSTSRSSAQSCISPPSGLLYVCPVYAKVSCLSYANNEHGRANLSINGYQKKAPTERGLGYLALEIYSSAL